MDYMDIHSIYQLYLEHPEVSTDSRRLTPGCLFVALHGERFDGNAYAHSALKAGAAYAIVDDQSLEPDPRLILVEDTLTTLQELAALHRATLGTPVIAITGTNGKTTTKELSAAVLSRGYELLYTEGNLNNHIGVPLTLLRLRRAHQLALIEMGASAPGDIDELCQIAQPNYGVITNIGLAHLEGFGSIEGVERTKGELYDWLRRHEGKVIRREGDERLARLGRGIPAVTYGSSPEAVVYGELDTESDSPYLCFTWGAEAIDLRSRYQRTKLVGAYNIDNALVAVALGLFFDVKPDDIAEALETYTPSNSRSQLVVSGSNEIIADAYNANPSSMTTALDNFLSIPTDKRRIIILGDMNELGEDSLRQHRAILDHLYPYWHTAKGELWLCGPIWTRLAGSTHHCFADTATLIESLEAHRPEQALILVKGSNGIGLERIIPYL